MTAADRARTPARVPRWPEAAAEEPDFAAIRAEFDVPEEFPPDVRAEAERRAQHPELPELDATDVPLVTLDPPGSRDLDQAVQLAARDGGGYLVSYAIADVGSFVRLGSAVDAEARRRSCTRVGSPSASSSMLHSTAGRSWSGSRLAAPSLSTGGCSGVRRSGL